MDNNKLISGDALNYAFNRFREEGIKLKPVCIDIGGINFYQEIYAKHRRRTPIEYSVL